MVDVAIDWPNYLFDLLQLNQKKETNPEEVKPLILSIKMW
jgi:hypothetical protein